MFRHRLINSLAECISSIAGSAEGRGEELCLEIRMADHSSCDAVVESKEQATAGCDDGDEDD